MNLHELFQYPIIQGPMAGGPSTPTLVAAASNAGVLGSFAASLLTSEAMLEQIGQIRALTQRPFAVNLFVQRTPQPSADEVAQAAQLLKPIWSALGWQELPTPAKWCEDFNAQFDALVAAAPAVASFTFDILNVAQVARLHAAGIFVIGTVTTVAEGLAWQAVGADAVVASGVESGGHRGTFLGPQTDATLGTADLLRQMVGTLDIPIISAGGIMHGAGIAELLALGASAVQMGTAFLVSDESGIHPAYKQRLLNAGQQPTRLTRAFSGRYARGLENRFMDLMQPVEKLLPLYPVQNALTGSIRAAAAKAGETEFMSLWAGASVNLARAMPVAQLVQTLVEEMKAAT
ncbi:NAD(P)H-dependent flavin oxidoreductase [Janthinobacterium fluminis]|uniref:Propionate 3-nitronate monooxygenase n=1 Tax=Janthinobacterium fluminis TaxID=2987524 RepID=A0ABT5JYM0_9BURK|nr:nitronate monooxygenase [Janthinobacterium fluminis]MDC8757818.1 nitronate monooxygenase [Janthinobacterium fluminis]